MLDFLEIEEIPFETFYAMKWISNRESFKTFKCLYEKACGLERDYVYYINSYEKVDIDNISNDNQIIIRSSGDLPTVYLPWKLGTLYPEKCMIIFSNKGFISIITEEDFHNQYRYKK